MKDSDWHQQPQLETLMEAPSDISTIEESPVSMRKTIDVTIPSDEELESDKDPEIEPKKQKQKRRFLKWILLIISCDLFFGSISKAFKDFTSKEFPAGMKHGSVVYSSTSQEEEEEEDGEKLFLRDVTAPCGYGVLTFTVGPAAEKAAPPYYAFDIYQTEYSFYHGWCFWKPIYHASHMRNYPFAENSSTTTTIPIPFSGKMKRISSLLFGTSVQNRSLAQRCGDYVVIAEGSFFNPEYFDGLVDLVRNWTIEEIEEKMEGEHLRDGISMRRIFEEQDPTMSLRDMSDTAKGYNERPLFEVIDEREEGVSPTEDAVVDRVTFAETMFKSPGQDVDDDVASLRSLPEPNMQAEKVPISMTDCFDENVVDNPWTEDHETRDGGLTQEQTAETTPETVTRSSPLEGAAEKSSVLTECTWWILNKYWRWTTKGFVRWVYGA